MNRLRTAGIVSVAVVIVIISASCETAFADNTVAECGANLRYDTTTLQNNYAYRLSLAETINEANYDEMSHNGTVTAIIGSVPISFGYNDFKKSVHDMETRYSKEVGVLSNTQLSKRAVSESSWDAYSECLSKNSSNPISAWVSNIHSIGNGQFETVAITFRTVQSPQVVSYVVVDGDVPHPSKPIKMQGTAQKIFIFRHPKQEGFSLILNLQEEDGTPFSSSDVYMPDDVTVSEVTSDVLQKQTAECKAGSKGSVTGNRIEPVLTFVPSPGNQMMTDYKMTSRQLGSPYSPMAEVADLGFEKDPVYGWHKSSGDGLTSKSDVREATGADIIRQERSSRSA